MAIVSATAIHTAIAIASRRWARTLAGCCAVAGGAVVAQTTAAPLPTPHGMQESVRDNAQAAAPEMPIAPHTRELHLPWPLSSGWRVRVAPGAVPGRTVQVLERDARQGPSAYRVIVIPGSGCTGFAPFAAAYFSGLVHAQVWVLHKPGVSVHAGPSPRTCPAQFTAGDALSLWQADALAALQHHLDAAQEQPPLPTLLVGISEGGELVPGLAPAVPQLLGGVLLSSPGLDPGISGAMQAERQGQTADWQRLERAAASPLLRDAWQVQGRTLKYWRDLFAWRVAQPLVDASWPLLQVWGSADTQIPSAAYEAFARHAAAQRRGVFCSWRMAEADHGLASPNGASGREALWAVVQTWGITGQMPACKTALRSAG